MDAPAFLAHLGRKRFAPAYLLLGADSYLSSLCRERLIEAAVPAEARGLAVARVSLKESSLTDLLRQAETLTLMSPRQVLSVADIERVAESELEELAAYLEKPNPATVLIFEAPRLDRRTKLARLLEEQCEVIQVESPAEDTEAAAAAQEFAGELGVRLEPAALEELIFAVGRDLGRLRQELEKLRLYVGAARAVGPDDIAAVVHGDRRWEVFTLVEPLAQGDREEALRLIRRTMETGENPIGIVGLLAWLYRQLLQVQALSRKTPAWEAARQLGVPRTRVETLLRQARRFTRSQLQHALALLFEADWTLKSSPPDATAILETLIVRLTSPRPERAAAAP